MHVQEIYRGFILEMVSFLNNYCSYFFSKKKKESKDKDNTNSKASSKVANSRDIENQANIEDVEEARNQSKYCD